MQVIVSDAVDEKTFSVDFDETIIDNRACYSMLDKVTYAYTVEYANARNACYEFAAMHFKQVLSNCIEFESEDELYMSDIRALFSIANTLTSEFFVDIVTRVLFSDSCSCDISVK